MPPFFSSINRIFVLLAVWSALAFSICMLLSVTTSVLLRDCLLLFGPLYFLCLLFVLPNYYICRGLPLGQTAWATMLASHMLTLLAIAAMWVLAGRAYAGFLDSISQQLLFNPLFDESLTINLAIVVIQFEAIVLIHYLYFAMEKTRDIEQAALQQKLLISQAELQALKATVHPHFLFNSLNTLSNIALSSGEKAHRFCLLIAEFLRYSVAYSDKSTATLSDELEHIQNYLGIERERFGELLQTSFEIDDGLLDTVVPPLNLFPVVENAVKHGIDSCLEGGMLSIVVRRGEETLIIEVSNPVDELGRKLKGTGHGLSSVEHRLKNLYGGQARLNIRRETGQFTVQIYIPIEKEANPEDQAE